MKDAHVIYVRIKEEDDPGLYKKVKFWASLRRQAINKFVIAALRDRCLDHEERFPDAEKLFSKIESTEL